MKKVIAIIIILVSLLVICSASAISEFYPRCAMVTEIDETEDLVTVEDFAGVIWQFYGVEDFIVGDLVAMLLWDCGTPDSIFDDEIIDAVYGGYNFQYQGGTKR